MKRMKYNVLIADDNVEVQKYLTNYLNWPEYEMKVTKVASSGAEAIAYLKENKVDAALIDLNIQGINGIDIVKEIKSLGLKTYPIVMGGYKSKKYINKALEIGAKDVIYKNIDEKALNTALLKSYYHLKINGEKKEIIPNAAMELMELVEMKEQMDTHAVNRIFDIVLEASKKENSIQTEVFSSFWSEFWLISKKKYGWLDNLFNFYKHENFLWENEMSESELELEFINIAERFGSMVQKFDICQGDGRVREICANIIKEVENEVCLESIANEMNYSKNHICTLFKQKSGNSFIDYVNTVKIERAKERLENSTLRNYEVGKLVGFKNTDYFMRVFKQNVGMTPGEYRIFARKNERNRYLARISAR